jgi:hypothetical protein
MPKIRRNKELISTLSKFGYYKGDWLICKKCALVVNWPNGIPNY